MGEEKVEAQAGLQGTVALEAIVALIASIMQVIQNSLADGKFGFEDIGQLMLLVPTIPGAIAAFPTVGAEIQELSDADRLAINSAIDLNFGDGAYEKVGERVLTAVMELAGAFDAFKKLQA